MHHKGGLIAVTVLFMGLGGCAPQNAAVPGRLTGPSSWTMVAPQLLPEPQAGEDAKQLLAQCRAEFGRETGKIVPLQSFVRRVTKKKD